MNCEEFRQAIGAEPQSAHEALQEHAATCAACARYWQDMRQMDGLIARALRIDVPAPAEEKRSRFGRRTGYWAAAASLAATLGLGSFLWLAQPSDSFAAQLVEHAEEEAAALIETSQRVEDAHLAAILQQAGVRLKPGAVEVSYVMSCAFRGHQVPHFVVQTLQGPVTVLVLRDEAPIDAPMTFSEDGYEGVITPAPHGVLAVLGRGVPVTTASQVVLRALVYDGTGDMGPDQWDSGNAPSQPDRW